MSKRMTFLIFNVLGLEITWAACAYGATHSMPLFGVIVGAIYLIIHFALTPSRRNDFLTMCCLAAIGISLDYINMRFEIISFHQGVSDISFLPLWLVVLWCVFVLMIPHSLYWLRKRPVLSAALGGIGGSSSYWLGDKFGAIFLSEPLTISIGVYFIQWAIYIIVAFSVLRFINHTTGYPALTSPQKN